MQIEETTKEFTKTLNPILDKAQRWQLETLELLPNIVVAILLMVLFVVLARMLRRLLDTYLIRVMTNKNALGVISNLSYFIVLLVGFMMSLSVLGLENTANKFLAGAGIVGVALGFAFQDIASNFISGTFMAFKSSFKVGDLIETNGVKAVVESINLRSTHLKTLDGYEVIIPNKEMFTKMIKNFNKYSTMRVSIECGVAYDSDLDLVERETLEVIRKIDEIKSTPSPVFNYTKFGDSSIDYRLTFWVDYLSVRDYLDGQHLAIKGIKKRYDELGIEIPFPIRTLQMGSNSSSSASNNIE